MTTETEVLEQGELDALLGSINTRTPTGSRNYAMLMLMAHTGLRCNEVLQVTGGDIRVETWGTNGDEQELWVVRLPRKAIKGNVARQGLPLSAAVRRAIEAWQEHRSGLGITGGALFCTISKGRRMGGFSTGDGELVPGRAVNPRYVGQLVTRLATRAGIERRVHPHMLRHTALTRVYQESKDLRLTQNVAGHTSSKHTERYAHVRPENLARAMGAMGEASEETGEGEGKGVLSGLSPEQLEAMAMASWTPEQLEAFARGLRGEDATDGGGT